MAAGIIAVDTLTGLDTTTVRPAYGYGYGGMVTAIPMLILSCGTLPVPFFGW